MTEGLKTGAQLLSIAVPDELADLRPDLQRFFDAMIYKLRRNKSKGRWQDVSLDKAFEGLRAEVEEMAAAIAEGSTMEILMESADTANFAMIIAAIALEAKGV